MMGFFSGAAKLGKRVGALLAGIPLAFLGGFLLYKSFAGEAGSRFLAKAGVVVLLVGLGLVLYSFSGSAATRESSKTDAVEPEP